MMKADKKANKIESRAFETSIVAPTQGITSSCRLTIKADMDYEDAHDELSTYDVLIVPGSPLEPLENLLKSPTIATTEPIPVIKAFAELQKTDPSKERTLLSIGTGALLLGQAGVLQGMGATTHPDAYTRLELTCQEASRRDTLSQTDVMEDTPYVVNNARFDLGEMDENPFILRQKPDNRRKSIARKGSNAWKESVKRRESNARRAAMRLGGLRVITSAAGTAGVDAALYLVAAMASHDAAVEVGKGMGYEWSKGITVDGIDV